MPSSPTARITFYPELGKIILSERPILLRSLTAITAVASATGIAWLLPSRADPSHFTLYFVAVMLSAWYGGFGVGLLATILSALLLDYFFISPLYAIELDWRAFLRLAVFVIVAFGTSYLTSARKRAEAELRQVHAELEDRVRERTAELARANDSLREEIVERKSAEQKLLRLQQEMGRVERLATLGRMTATIAHDLGTPLNSVLGYTQLLAQENIPERTRHRLAIIETQIKRMVEIIQRYLSHTRGSVPRGIVNLNDLIRDTLLLLQPIFQRRGIEISTKLSKTLPSLQGDGNSIQRMMINLLQNAVDACERSGKIEIRTRQAAPPTNNGHGVTIEIADTGAGISSEILPKIFDFLMTTKPAGKGTGMGLVICQEIVKAHGGTIHVASQVGQGTTVSVYLPVDDKLEQPLQTEDIDECANSNRG